MIRWAWLVGLLVVVGCAGAVDAEPTPVWYRVVVDEDWSPEQAEQILDGIDFWRGELGEWVQVVVTTGPCDENTRGCIAAVDSDNPTLLAAAERNGREIESAGDDMRVVGDTTAKAILLDRQYGDLAGLVRHEFGHRLGLRHADGGVMQICVGSSEITPEVVAHLERRGLR